MWESSPLPFLTSPPSSSNVRTAPPERPLPLSPPSLSPGLPLQECRQRPRRQAGQGAGGCVWPQRVGGHAWCDHQERPPRLRSGIGVGVGVRDGVGVRVTVALHLTQHQLGATLHLRGGAAFSKGKGHMATPSTGTLTPPDAHGLSPVPSNTQATVHRTIGSR